MEKEKSTIHFILTGGTIDSFYEGTKDTVTTLEHSKIPEYLTGLKLHEETKFTEICMKDSRDLIEQDMENITNAIEESNSKKVIVTIGTYTMPDTAKYLKANLKRDDQTIIFTGSMIPLMGFAPSDASFNLGYSIAKVQDLQPGICVCMNGKIFSPEEVAKLLYEGRFISIFGEKKNKD
ncbi:asparaginase [Candidatus Woesearchaeota archaeon]|jgi:L-asparaginase|nr:asparaginase [Candidatus Woesearchaeota archaeon]